MNANVTLRALFQRGHGSPEAQNALAALRFAQMGVGAELYAHVPDDLDGALRRAPDGPLLPTVHLSRDISLLTAPGRELAAEFAARCAGRVAGLVVHDQAAMAELDPGWLAEMHRLNDQIAARSGAPMLFVEYAAGLAPERFAELARRLAGAAQVSCCIDAGHLGRHVAEARFDQEHPGVPLAQLTAGDPRLPALAADVQAAVTGALPAVIEVIEAVGAVGKPVHFHLHDGHPVMPRLADHFSFLTQLPVPFEHDGRRSLALLYGPAGLDALLAAAAAACGQAGASVTLEIHQGDGRLPLADAATMFAPGPATEAAERDNYWLGILAQNVLLARRQLDALGCSGR